MGVAALKVIHCDHAPKPAAAINCPAAEQATLDFLRAIYQSCRAKPRHDLFQTIYEDHFEGQDSLAERIKAIDGHAEGMLSAMVSRSKVNEHDGHATDREMIAAIVEAQETLAETLAGASDIAASHGDKLTEDLCIARGQVHEKFAWMLRSHLA